MNKIYSLKYNQQHQLVAVSELCSRRKPGVSVNKKLSIKNVLPVNKIPAIVSVLSVLMTTCFFGTAFASVTSSHFPYQTYRDFAENKGAFQVGALNVPIYNSSGNLLDHLDSAIPFPDFSSVDVRKSIATLISPQYAVGARHVRESGNLVFGNNSYGVVAKNEDAGPAFPERGVDQRDFDIKRLSKLVTDVAPIPYYAGMGSEENFFVDKEKFPLFYRVGSGDQSISPNPPEDFRNKTDIAGSYLWRTGGVIDVSYSHKVQIFSTEAASLLPTLVQLGDSGSPLFAWDAQNKRWVVVGVTSLVYGSTTYWDHVFPDFTAEVIEKDRDPDVTFTPGKGALLWTFNRADGTGSLKQQDSEFVTHGKNENVVMPAEPENVAPDLVAREKAALNAAKNLSFRGNGGEIILQNDIDQGAGSLTFYDNYTVSSESSQSWIGAGIDVAKDVTVNWKVNGRDGDNLHKTGQGTLKIAATGVNPGGLRVGDGTVILSQQPDNDGKVQAFSNLSLVSGRPEVILSDNRQVNPDNITWGFRGGKLDINGNDITFNKLYANASDYGSVITNASTRKATINLNIAPVKAPVVNDSIVLQDLSRLKRGETGDLYKMGFSYYVLKNNGFPTMPLPNASDEYWEYAGQNRGYAEDIANKIKSKYFDDKTKFIFSGKITGNNDVNIIAKPQFSFIVDGDIDIADGTFQQQQGELVFQGHPIIHAYNNTIIADKIRALGDDSVKTQPVSFDQTDWESRHFSVKTLELTGTTFRLARNATLQGDINATRAKIILGSPELYINKNDGDIESHQDVIAGISVANTDADKSRYQGNVKLADNSTLEIREKFAGSIQASNNSTVTVFSDQAALTHYSQFTKTSSLTLNAGAQLTAYAGWNNDNTVTVTDGATLTLSANTLKSASAAVVPAYYVSKIITLQGNNAVVNMAPGSYSSGYINDQGNNRILLGGGSLPDAGGFSAVYAGIVNASQGTMQVDNAHWLITGNSALKQMQGSNGLLSFSDATTTEQWFTDQVARQDGASDALADNPFPAVTASRPYSLQLDTLNTTGSTFAFRVNPYNGEHDQLTVNTMLSGENNRLQADYVGTDNGAMTARQEHVVVSAPLSTAADHFMLVQSGADGRVMDSATGNQWRTGLAVLSDKIQRQWWLLNMNDTMPWRLTENRQFDLLSLPTKGRVELSQPDSGWAPRILQTDTLAASGVHFALTARPQSGESDSIIINKLASGGDNNLDLTLLMQADTVVNDSSLLLATAPLATADSYFNVGMLNPRGLTLYAPNLSVVSTDTAKQWRLLYKSTSEETVSAESTNTDVSSNADLSNSTQPPAGTDTIVSADLPADTESPIVSDDTSNVDADLNSSTQPPTGTDTIVSADLPADTESPIVSDDTSNVDADLNSSTQPPADAGTIASANLPAGTESPIVTGGTSNVDVDLSNSTQPPAGTDTIVSADLPAGTESPIVSDGTSNVDADLNSSTQPPAGTDTIVSADLPAGTESPIVTGGTSNVDADLNSSTQPPADAGTIASANLPAGTESAANTAISASTNPVSNTASAEVVSTGSASTVNLNTSNTPVTASEPAAQPAPTQPAVNIPPVTTASGLSLFTAFSLKLSELNSAVSREEIATRLQQAGITADNNMIDSYHSQITQVRQQVTRTGILTSLPQISFVLETNQLNKRLGDVRQLNEDTGLWIKTSRGQADYQQIQLKHTTLQMGFDHRNGKQLYGIMGSYTRGSGQGMGLSENHTTGGAGIYYSWINNDGPFIDVVAKYLKNHQHYTFPSGLDIPSQGAGSNTLLASVQAGWHATFIDSLFVEPSAEVVAGHTTGYMLRGDQSSFNIRVNASNPIYAKIGASAGVNFQADDQHGLTLAAGIFRLQNLRRGGGVDMLNNSVQGDMLRNPMADDSRYLVNISVNARISGSWRIYSQFESSFAAKNLKNDYSGQFGVRYQF